MRPACESYRRAWFEASSGSGSVSGPAGRAEDHVGSCEACLGWTRRSRQVTGLLGSLTRLAAPGELDRRVGGELTQRAAAESGGPTPIRSSEGILATLERLQAPAVLDRLVAEELADPEKASVARHVRRLERRRAPAVLAEKAQRLRGNPDRTRQRRAAAAALVAFAASGLVWIGLGRPAPEPGTAPAAPGRVVATPRLAEPVRIASPHELDLRTQGLVAALAPELVHGQPTPDAGPLASPRREPRIPAVAPAEAPAEVQRLLEVGSGSEPPVLRMVPVAPAAPNGSLEDRPDGSSTAPERGAGRFYNDLTRVAHAGLRQVEIATPVPGGGARLLAFREAIVTDGLGGYRIEPFDVLTPVEPDAETFLVLQRGRQGHSFRYRDFAVRDPGLFARNYEVERTGQRVDVAGRACQLVRVTHREGERSFRLAVDIDTGAILSDREFDADGNLVRSVEYLDFDPVPDLSLYRSRAPSLEEIHTVDEISELTGGRAWRPTTTPADHFLASVSLVGGEDTRWVKWAYNDGVKSLFFLHRPARRDRRGTPRAEEIGVQLFSTGSMRAVHGTWGDDEFFALGSVSEAELLDLVQSALP